MTLLFLFLFTGSYLVFGQQGTPRVVKGTVSDYDDPIAGVKVSILKGATTRTDSLGNFSISAQLQDIVEFTYPGRDTVKVLVNTNTRVLAVEMPLTRNELEEAIVEGEKPPEKKKLRKSLLTVSKTMLQEDFPSNAQFAWDVLRGRFGGVTVDQQSAQVYIRHQGKRLKAASWEIDGMFFECNQPPYHLAVSNIESISIVQGTGATVRYGALGAGGIIVIKTKNQDPEANAPNYDQARLRHNIYKDAPIYQSNKTAAKPIYIQLMGNAENVAEAYGIYLEQKKLRQDNPDFFIASYELFASKWATNEKTESILSDFETAFQGDVGGLRLLAYTYEENGEFLKAVRIYSQIYTLKPSAQAVRNLANVYVVSGQYKRAWNLYTEFIRKAGVLKTEGTEQLIREEMTALLLDHGTEMGMDPSKFALEKDLFDIQLIVEWNNPNTAFELQFVGPEKHYFKWKNTAEISQEERYKGNTSYGFYIDDIKQGDWLINLKYLGNLENTPSYLKFTVRDNKKKINTVKVIKLDGKDVNYRILEVKANRSVAYKS